MLFFLYFFSSIAHAGGNFEAFEEFEIDAKLSISREYIVRNYLDADLFRPSELDYQPKEFMELNKYAAEAVATQALIALARGDKAAYEALIDKAAHESFQLAVRQGIFKESSSLIASSGALKYSKRIDYGYEWQEGKFAIIEFEVQEKEPSNRTVYRMYLSFENSAWSVFLPADGHWLEYFDREPEIECVRISQSQVTINGCNADS